MKMEKTKCNVCDKSILIQTAERYERLCKLCFRQLNTKSVKDIELDESHWKLSPKNAHPNAKEKLKDSFLWNIADDNSPLGNNTGADVLHFYRKWAKNNPHVKATDFLSQILRSWEIKNKDWNLFDEDKLLNELPINHYNILVRDDVIISLAFSQIVLFGMVNKEIKRKALWAIKRQRTDTVIDFRGWDNFAEERKERLTIMKSVLKKI